VDKDKLKKIDRRTDLPFWIAFSFFEGVGPLRFALLLKYFGSAHSAWEAKSKKWAEIGVSSKLIEKFQSFKKAFPLERLKVQADGRVDFSSQWLADEERRKQFWWVKRAGGYRESNNRAVKVLTWMDEAYPERLRLIKASPPVVYISASAIKEGDFVQLWRKPTVAVVGTRKITSYGRGVTEKIVKKLVGAGVVVISGMARGVDGVAHRAALENGGQTVAVLGSGVDIVYPAENRDIYERLVGKNDAQPNDSRFSGLVISEFPLGFPPLPGNFPARNRIIAGLSQAVLVTEAAEDSGSLITARLAGEQGRDVFAIPGPITSSLSQGTSFLIKQGAKLVTGADDILEEMGVDKSPVSFASRPNEEEMSKEEKQIWRCLENEERYIDDIIRQTGLKASQAGGMLSLMAVKGWVKDLGGGRWRRE